MNSRSGGSAVGALFAVDAPLYGHYVTGMELPAIERFSCFAGSFSVICMAAGMLLSARPRSLDSPFGGLDRNVQAAQASRRRRAAPLPRALRYRRRRSGGGGRGGRRSAPGVARRAPCGGIGARCVASATDALFEHRGLTTGRYARDPRGAAVGAGTDVSSSAVADPGICWQPGDRDGLRRPLSSHSVVRRSPPR